MDTCDVRKAWACSILKFSPLVFDVITLFSFLHLPSGDVQCLQRKKHESVKDHERNAKQRHRMLMWFLKVCACPAVLADLLLSTEKL